MNRFLAAFWLCFSIFIGLASCFPWERGRNGAGVPALKPSGARSLSLQNPQLRYFSQQLDHFNASNTETWEQRYWVDFSDFDGKGPVFLVVGDMYEVEPSMLAYQQIANFADYFNALVVLVEHRYYGESIPTDDFSIANLKYLTIEQALADLASIRQYIQSSMNLTTSNKWITYGSYYGGVLAAWFKQKYPNWADGVIAISAPLLAGFDADQFLPVAADTLEDYDPKCVQSIEKASEQFATYAVMHQDALQNMFQTCHPIGSTDDIQLLAYHNAAVFSYAPEYQNTDLAPIFNTSAACQVMNNASIGNELTRYAHVISTFLDYFEPPCQESTYKDYLQDWRNITDFESGNRPFMYQYCTELGQFPTLSSMDQPFGNLLLVPFWVRLCNDAFDMNYDLNGYNAAMNATNAKYGGFNYQGTVAVFVSGELDPWKQYYITPETNPMSNPYIRVMELDGVGSFDDFTSITDTVQAARVVAQIISLINQYVLV